MQAGFLTAIDPVLRNGRVECAPVDGDLDVANADGRGNDHAAIVVDCERRDRRARVQALAARVTHHEDERRESVGGRPVDQFLDREGPASPSRKQCRRESAES